MGVCVCVWSVGMTIVFLFEICFCECLLCMYGYNFFGCVVLCMCHCVGEVVMGFQDVVILPSRASFSTIFFENCGNGEGLRSIKCLKVVIGVSKGMLHGKYFCSTNPPSCDIRISWRL